MINKTLCVIIALVCALCIVPGTMALVDASFTAIPVSGTAAYPPFTVYYTDTSTGEGGGATFLWNFGDGYTSALKNPTHTYLYNGTYSTSLVVDNGGGDIDNDNVYYSITVLDLNPMTGSGVINDPYIITTPEQWSGLEGKNAYFALGNNIDFQSDLLRSKLLQRVSGSIDGRGYALKNFYAVSNSFVDIVGNGQYALGMIATGYNSLKGGYSIEIKNLILQNCTLISNTSIVSRGGYNIGLLTGGYGSYGGTISNIYVDENSYLYINGSVTQPIGGVYASRIIGGISGDPESIVNAVFMGHIYVNQSLTTDPGFVYDNLGGICAYQSQGNNYLIKPRNVLMGGTMTYTAPSGAMVGTVVGYTYIPNGLYPGNNLYYDSTKLAGVPVSQYSYGVPTSGMTTQSNFPNMTFGVGGMAMSELTSIYDGYPVPYLFTMIVPVPTITPTAAPTGTPIITPIVTPSVTPTLGVSSIKWTNLKGETITSAYIGDPIRFNYDTGGIGINPPTYKCDGYYFMLWDKNTQTGLWVYDTLPSFNAQVKGSTDISILIGSGYGQLYSGNRWVGYGTMTAGDDLAYKVGMYGFNITNPTLYPAYNYGNVTIIISQNPWLVSNIGTWADSVGGDGLRYFLGLLIILGLACIPYLLLRAFNLYLEIIMVVFGLGIDLYAGLFDLWVLFALAIGLVAIYFLLNRGGGNTEVSA